MRQATGKSAPICNFPAANPSDAPDWLPLPPPPSHRWPETQFNQAYQDFLDAHVAYWGSEECVVLPKFAGNALRTVANWRRGCRAVDVIMPMGTPVASFMDRRGRPSDRWDGGEGLGITGNHTTHSGVLAGYLLDAYGSVIGLKLWEIYPGASRVRRRIYPVDDSRFGTANARAYHAVFDIDQAPLGGPDNPYYRLWLTKRQTPPVRSGWATHTPAAAGRCATPLPRVQPLLQGPKA
ncbi:hypothetical protein ACFQFQ_01925 [Sulfitobacter porphyrae]|uniref:Uncharacterized protein n=1 Tax=Sulfitobacter porphyrae TaxID=1246864 RepID=A0ABW2B0Z0_9RHOB